MLGRLAASGELPIPHDALRAAIAAGVAPEANLRAFEAGLAMTDAAPAETAAPTTTTLPALLQHAAGALPAPVLAVADIALPRLTRYQNARYAARWLDRLRPILALDTPPFRLAEETARQLTLWMGYDDVIKVAAHKSSAARFAEIRAETRARPDEPIAVTEHMKPGWEELASLLPPFAGRRLLAWADRTGRLEQGVSLRLESTSLSGFLRLFALARLRPWRPFTHRWAEEQRGIDAWLTRITAAAQRGDHALALEIATLPRLLKGYADTHRRGMRGYLAVLERVVDPALAAPPGDALAPARVARAREAALADPEHAALARALG
jgi:indolepyruvate ferredoxin oxidoreductase beta subunit